MTRHLRRLFLTATFVMCSTVAALAQTSIEKIVSKLEDSPKCKTTIYSETRDPKTHKIVSFNFMAQINDTVIVQRLINAFKSERKNAIRYSSNFNEKGERFAQSYHIEFESSNGMYSNYNLTYTKVRRKSAKSKGTSSESTTYSTYNCMDAKCQVVR